jgi:hypothetical protein
MKTEIEREEAGYSSYSKAHFNHSNMADIQTSDVKLTPVNMGL